MPVKKRKRKIPPMDVKQQEALDFMCENEDGLIEYGTGTGKTRIGVEFLRVLVDCGDIPALLIVPNALIEQWVEQFHKWLGRKWTEKHVAVLGSAYTIQRRRDILRRRSEDVYLISTESLSYKEIREAISYSHFSACLLEEASRFRNHSKRVTTLKLVGARSDSRYALTGRLVVRTPADAFYIMDWLRPNIFGTRRRDMFINEYCMKGGYFGNDAIDFRPDKIDQFREIMDGESIRCQLSDIRELPKRDLIVYHVDMPKRQAEAYRQMRDELKLQIERVATDAFRSKATTYATRLQRLQEIAAGFARNLDKEVEYLPSPKTTELAEILQESPDVPTIVWYWWIPELHRIQSELQKRGIEYVTFGDVDARTRFRKGKVNVFLTQLARGGYGLDLPNAIRMIYHSLPWDLDIYQQSQERNMRRNTKAKYLEIIHLIVRNSADGYVRHKLVSKADMSSKLSRSDALELLRACP